MQCNGNDLRQLSERYGLPPMKYSQKLRPGSGAYDRKTGEIQLSESLRFVGEAELLRVAFHEAGHHQTRSFLREVLPLRLAVVFAVVLGLCLAFASVRFWFQTAIPFFGLVASAIIFENGRQRSEQEASRWARDHWPDELLAQGFMY